MIKFVDWNERRHRVDAYNDLKQLSLLVSEGFGNSNIHQHRLSDEQALSLINEKLTMERQFNNSGATCVAVNEDLVLVGTTVGELQMYDRMSQEPYAIFVEKGKDF